MPRVGIRTYEVEAHYIDCEYGCLWFMLEIDGQPFTALAVAAHAWDSCKEVGSGKNEAAA